MTGFNDFNLSEPILHALKEMGFEEPSPIQKKTIPLIQGGHDVIALAETGSGKTATCAIPICDRVDVTSTHVQALIIVPTRELALQYATETQRIGGRKGVKAFALYGGEDMAMQKSKLKHGVQVLVATPGRLIDFIYQRAVHLDHVETLILDEADEMLSMGFYDDLRFIIECLVHEHQTLLFSATMPRDIREMAERHMKTPQEVKLTTLRAAPTSIEHEFLYCAVSHKADALADLLHHVKPYQSIIFCQSRIQCERVARSIRTKIHGVEYLHGGLSQDVRTIITDKFRAGRIKHLVATDVAARGLDFSDVTHVFIFQMSKEVDMYIHRSGRTGRQDRKGTVISLVSREDLGVVKRIIHRLNREVKWLGTPPPSLDEEPAPRRRPPSRGHPRRPRR